MHDRKGYYFGLFFLIYSLSNITAGLITTLMLGLFEIEVFFWILEGISVITLLFCIFVLPDVQKKYMNVEISDGPVLMV